MNLCKGCHKKCKSCKAAQVIAKLNRKGLTTEKPKGLYARTK